MREVDMNIPRSFLSMALTAAFSATLLAQEAPSGFHRVACLKVSPQNSDAYRKFVSDDSAKVMQAEIKSGIISGWLLMRSVVPQGESARCDYLSVSVLPGYPTQHPNALADAIKQAGLKMTADEYISKRDSLTTLVSNDLFQTRAMVGGIKKGDYLEVLYQNTPNRQAWLANEMKVWKPVAESMLKDGSRTGWYAVYRLLPAGSEMKYNAINVDVFPSLEAVFKGDPHFEDRWKSVHPEMDLNQTMQGLARFRTTVNEELYTVIDAVAPAN
jgi:hypothetical protein